VLAGQLLRSDRPLAQKLMRLLIAGLAGLILGQVISVAGVCPIVKRIWTPAWAIYSGGWVVLLLAGFVAVIEWQGWLLPALLWVEIQLSTEEQDANAIILKAPKPSGG
jgi:predicted acyltransferase